jgi:hypothetical protein
MVLPGYPGGRVRRRRSTHQQKPPVPLWRRGLSVLTDPSIRTDPRPANRGGAGEVRRGTRTRRPGAGGDPASRRLHLPARSRRRVPLWVPACAREDPGEGKDHHQPRRSGSPPARGPRGFSSSTPQHHLPRISYCVPSARHPVPVTPHRCPPVAPSPPPPYFPNLHPILRSSLPPAVAMKPREAERSGFHPRRRRRGASGEELHPDSEQRRVRGGE